MTALYFVPYLRVTTLSRLVQAILRKNLNKRRRNKISIHWSFRELHLFVQPKREIEFTIRKKNLLRSFLLTLQDLHANVAPPARGVDGRISSQGWNSMKLCLFFFASRILGGMVWCHIHWIFMKIKGAKSVQKCMQKSIGNE